MNAWHIGGTLLSVVFLASCATGNSSSGVTADCAHALAPLTQTISTVITSQLVPTIQNIQAGTSTVAADTAGLQQALATLQANDAKVQGTACSAGNATMLQDVQSASADYVAATQDLLTALQTLSVPEITQAEQKISDGTTQINAASKLMQKGS